MPTAITGATAQRLDQLEASRSTQMNTRIDAALKAQGDAVLARYGLTPSQAVRSLWTYLFTHNDLPDYLKEQQMHAEEDVEKRMDAVVERGSGLAWKLAQEFGLLMAGADQRYQMLSDDTDIPSAIDRIKDEIWDEKAEEYRTMVGVHDVQ